MSGRHKVAGGLKVRGSCDAGHITEAVTDPGRTAWEGPCGTEGCELKVRARQRVTNASPAAPAAPPSEPEPADPPVVPAPTSKPKVKQVDYDAQPPKRDQRPDDGGSTDDPGEGARTEPPEEPAADLQRPAKRAAGGKRRRSPAARPDPEPVEDPGRSSARGTSVRERITGRRRQEAQSKPRREFSHPLDW